MTIPAIQRHRIEAELIKEVYTVPKDRCGKEPANKVIAESIHRSAISQAQLFATNENRPR